VLVQQERRAGRERVVAADLEVMLAPEIDPVAQRPGFEQAQDDQVLPALAVVLDRPYGDIRPFDRRSQASIVHESVQAQPTPQGRTSAGQHLSEISEGLGAQESLQSWLTGERVSFTTVGHF